ncbi:MAG: copper resistance protein NlpE N-terminal domain-containing protein [Balneolaceae bacterium]|nr:copper resistance protein NlpE N-terminal domain-containing protein [Balneolaceae bacterium]
MNKVVNIAIIILLAIFISFRINVACNELAREKQLETPQADTKIELPAFYTGVLPCASCPGIQYWLILKEDHYEEISRYQDRDPTDFSKTGLWTLASDTLRILDDDYQTVKTFLLDDVVLELLDSDENSIDTEHPESIRLTKSAESRSIYQQHQKIKEDGVRLVASGNEPFWSVHIEGENKLNFLTPDSTLSFEINKPSGSDDKLSYSAEEDFGKFQLNLVEKYCQDTMSGYLFTHTATIEIAGNSMDGCATFLD